MSEMFLSQIAMFAFNFPPKGMAFCNGQLLPINQNQALFSLLGTTYGGNGQTNFALPDLRGRTPIGFMSSADAGWQPPGHPLGERAGSETVTLTVGNLAPHVHAVNASTQSGTTRNPGNAFYAATTPALHGPSTGALVGLNSTTVMPAGGSQAHNNMQPYLAANFCIALQGIYPSVG